MMGFHILNFTLTLCTVPENKSHYSMNHDLLDFRTISYRKTHIVFIFLTGNYEIRHLYCAYFGSEIDQVKLMKFLYVVVILYMTKNQKKPHSYKMEIKTFVDVRRSQGPAL